MERAVPVLPADDLTVAKDFYVRGLGFSVRFEASEDGRSGIMSHHHRLLGMPGRSVAQRL